MHRLQGRKTRRITSTLYENHVIPTLRKDERTVDFGAGRCVYADMLMKQSYNMLACAPHFREKGALKIRAIVQQINRLNLDIRLPESPYHHLYGDSRPHV